MIKWEDCTAYRRKEKDRTPRTWETKVGLFRVRVYRHRDYGPDAWLMTAYPSLLSEVELKTRDTEKAKCEAILKLQAVLLNALEAMEDYVHSDCNPRKANGTVEKSGD